MDSPLLSVMSHLLTFLERYSHMQRLQQRAQEYRSQLRVLATQRRKRIKELRAAYRQKLRDKMSVIGNLEGVISEQQSLLEKIQTGGEDTIITIIMRGFNYLVSYSMCSQVWTHKLMHAYVCM